MFDYTFPFTTLFSILIPTLIPTLVAIVPPRSRLHRPPSRSARGITEICSEIAAPCARPLSSRIGPSEKWPGKSRA